MAFFDDKSPVLRGVVIFTIVLVFILVYLINYKEVSIRTILSTITGSGDFAYAKYMPFVMMFMIVLILVIIGFYKTKETKEQWLLLSMDLGLKYECKDVFDYPTLSGIRKGRNVKIYTVDSGGSQYTLIDVNHGENTNFEINIQKKNMISTTKSILCENKIKLDNKKFNREYIIKTNNEQFARIILDDLTQTVILDSKILVLKVDSQVVEIEESGFVGDTSKLKLLLETAEKIAHNIDN